MTLVFFTSCITKTPKEEVKYIYSDDFKAYFKDAFKQELKSSSEYFIIPLSSCGQCVDSALTKIAENKYNWQIVLVGKTEDETRLKNISIAKPKYVFFNDSASVLNGYSVSIGLPTLLTTNNNGEVILKREFHFGSWLSFKNS